jgi:hypothetical protein
MRFKRLAWSELPPPGGYGSEAYTALVPAGSLPALKVGAHITQKQLQNTLKKVCHCRQLCPRISWSGHKCVL